MPNGVPVDQSNRDYFEGLTN